MSIIEQALEAVRLAEKATPGPWVIGQWSGQCHKTHGPEEKGPHHGKGFCVYDPVFHEDCSMHRIASTTPSLDVAGNYDVESGGIIDPNDTRFIAHAGTHYREIASAYLASQRRVEELELMLRATLTGCGAARTFLRGVLGVPVTDSDPLPALTDEKREVLKERLQ